MLRTGPSTDSTPYMSRVDASPMRSPVSIPPFSIWCFLIILSCRSLPSRARASASREMPLTCRKSKSKAPTTMNSIPSSASRCPRLRQPKPSMRRKSSSATIQSLLSDCGSSRNISSLTRNPTIRQPYDWHKRCSPNRPTRLICRV